MRHFIKKLFFITDNQCNLVIIYFISFLVQAIALYLMSPDKFRINIVIPLLLINIIYNSLYFKMMSE